MNYPRMYTFTHTYMHTFTLIWMLTYTHTCMHTYIYLYNVKGEGPKTSVWKKEEAFSRGEKENQYALRERKIY